MMVVNEGTTFLEAFVIPLVVYFGREVTKAKTTFSILYRPICKHKDFRRGKGGGDVIFVWGGFPGNICPRVGEVKVVGESRLYFSKRGGWEDIVDIIISPLNARGDYPP